VKVHAGQQGQVRLHIITTLAAPGLHSRRLGWLPISAHDHRSGEVVWVSRALSAAELLIMVAVICVSLGVMLAVVFLADRQPDRGRPPSGKSGGGSVRGEAEPFESGGYPRKRRKMSAQRRHDH
jgi:hypothetical protein